MLRNLQKAFLDSFYHSKKTITNFIAVKENLSLQEQLQIYADSIHEGKVKALREQYPITEKLVGEDFFRVMANEYIKNHPSSSPNLSDYGSCFANFVEFFAAAKCLPYLSDVCRLEWCWQKAYYGENYLPLDINLLSQIDNRLHHSLIFKRCSNSSLLKSIYPIKDIWDINQRDEIDEVIQFEKHQDQLLIWRPHMEVIITELTEPQWLILKAFDDGFSLGELSTLQETMDLSAEISHIFESGWFSSFEIKPCNLK